MVQEGPWQKSVAEQNLPQGKDSARTHLEKGVPGRRNSKRKGLEVGPFRACSAQEMAVPQFPQPHAQLLSKCCGSTCPMPAEPRPCLQGAVVPPGLVRSLRPGPPAPCSPGSPRLLTATRRLKHETDHPGRPPAEKSLVAKHGVPLRPTDVSSVCSQEK